MWKSISSFFKGLFSKRFVHPIVNERLATAIDDKINRENKERQAKIEKHNEILNQYVRTYFSRRYSDNDEMQIAFDTINKDWKKHCRVINSTDKTINLKSNYFEQRVKTVITNLKENGNK